MPAQIGKGTVRFCVSSRFRVPSAALDLMANQMPARTDHADGITCAMATPKYAKVVSMIITRNEDGRIAPATSCIDLWGKNRSKKYVGLGLVATHVTMPVTSCAAERNWSIWGQVYMKTRSNLVCSVRRIESM